MNRAILSQAMFAGLTLFLSSQFSFANIIPFEVKTLEQSEGNLCSNVVLLTPKYPSTMIVTEKVGDQSKSLQIQGYLVNSVDMELLLRTELSLGSEYKKYRVPAKIGYHNLSPAEQDYAKNYTAPDLQRVTLHRSLPNGAQSFVSIVPQLNGNAQVVSYGLTISDYLTTGQAPHWISKKFNVPTDIPVATTVTELPTVNLFTTLIVIQASGDINAVSVRMRNGVKLTRDIMGIDPK